MKTKIQHWFVFFSICITCLALSNQAFSYNKTINFATYDILPTTVDRILYTAFNKIGYDITLTNVGIVYSSDAANSGEKDAVAVQPWGHEKTYPNLICIPIPLANISFTAYTKEGSHIKIKSWEDFSGLQVGYLFQNPCVEKSLPSDAGKVNGKQNADLFSMLNNQAIDVAIVSQVTPEEIKAPDGIQNLGVFESIPAYAYVNKKYEALVVPITSILNEMEKDGTIKKIKDRSLYKNEEDAHTILHISSYSPDMVWESDLKRGLETTILENKKNVIYYFNLNSKRILNDENRSKLVMDTIRTNFIAKSPDVIVASDNNALNFVVENYNVLFPGVPVVFCGINGYEDSMIAPIKDYVTGVKEEISAYETVDKMLQLFPKTENIFVINDFLESGVKWRKEIETQLKPFENRVTITYNNNVTMQTLLDKLAHLPKNTLVLNGLYFVDYTGNYFSQKNAGELFADNCNSPMFGLLESGLGYGQVGGAYDSGFDQGTLAGEVALKVLGGTAVGDIPLVTNAKSMNKWKFDYTVLKKRGISEQRIPNGAVLINKPMTLRESNPTLFFSIVLFAGVMVIIIGGLCFFMYILRKRNRELVEAQKNLHSAEELLDKDVTIKKVKSRLEKIIQTAPLAYSVAIDGVVVESNTYAQKNMGLYVGVNTDVLYANLAVKQDLYRRLKDKHQLLGEVVMYKLVNEEQHRFHLNMTKMNYEDKEAYMMWGIDIEESERQKDAIEKSQHDLQKLIDFLPMPMLISDAHSQKIVYANRSYLSMFEFEKGESAVGVNFISFYPEYQPDGRKSSEAIADYAQYLFETGDTRAMEWQYVTYSGKVIDALIYATPIIMDGASCLIVLIQDIGAEKRQNEMLLNAADKEKEANQLKSRFLVNMSHEIRTPMNAIIGLSQIALMKEQTKENIESYRKINNSSKNLLTIINDILDFSKIEAEKLELMEDEFNLEDVISNAFLVSSERIGNKKIEMLLDMQASVPYELIGDKTRLWQVLKNLLDNAAKYTKEGRIILSVSLAQKAPDTNKVYLHFRVKDTGLGISKEHQQKLFKPFEQFHKVLSATSGTGLGMSITKQLVELMGGTIEVESEINVGTTIDVLIGFKKLNKAQTLQEMIQQKSIASNNILIVDDDKVSCDIMKNLLEVVGSTPVCLTSAAQVVDTILEYEQKGTPFDIIILDYLLGEQNGIEVAKHIKELTSNKYKLLMVSAYAKNLIASEIKDAHFNDIIEKPFVPSSFIECLFNTVSDDQNQKEVTYQKFPNAKVLICEDNELNQEVAMGMLDVFGIVPTIANNGQEGIVALEKESYHLVFMDILMPVLDGHATATLIRSVPSKYQNIPIVAMTANVMKDEVEKCMNEGMNGHVGKPLDFDEIYQYLLKYLPQGGGNTSEEIGSEPINEVLESVVDPLESIEGIHASEGINRFVGKKDRYINSLVRFAKEEIVFPTFEEAFSEENHKQMSEMIHGLKGVTGNLSIVNLYHIIVAFEKTDRSGNPDKVLYDEMVTCYFEMKNKILKKLS